MVASFKSYSISKEQSIYHSSQPQNSNQDYSVPVVQLPWNTHTHTQPFYCFSGICPGPPGWASTRKVKPILIYWSKLEIVSGSGICWAICKSAPHPRQPVAMESNKKIVRSQEEQISRAEILHLLWLIKHDQSFASCEDLIIVLHASFSDPFAHDMNLRATKASYSMAFGLGPYFYEACVSDSKMHGTACWLMKQQQIRNWSNSISMFGTGADLMTR